jgi:hypothetical protein
VAWRQPAGFDVGVVRARKLLAGSATLPPDNGSNPALDQQQEIQRNIEREK